MNNKLFIELLGPAAGAQAFAEIVPVPGELGTKVSRKAASLCYATSKLGRVLWDLFFFNMRCQIGHYFF